MTTDLAVRNSPAAVILTERQLNFIAKTDFIPKSMRGNLPAVLACVARGRAMGIPDMVALNGIAIIEGKATLSAELMVAIVRDHGHSITGDVTPEKAVVTGTRKDNGDTMTAEFNLEMAEAAGLLGKQNWKRHPDDMMWARAVSKLCRRLFADCFAGGTYAPEDLVESEWVDETTADEVIDEPVEESINVDGLVAELLGLAEILGKHAEVAAKVNEHASLDSLDEYVAWLHVQVRNARSAVAKLEEAAA